MEFKSSGETFEGYSGTKHDEDLRISLSVIDSPDYNQNSSKNLQKVLNATLVEVKSRVEAAKKDKIKQRRSLVYGKFESLAQPDKLIHLVAYFTPPEGPTAQEKDFLVRLSKYTNIIPIALQEPSTNWDIVRPPVKWFDCQEVGF